MKKESLYFRRHYRSMALLSAFVCLFPGYVPFAFSQEEKPSDVEFNDSFLSGSSIDLKRYTRGMPVFPGLQDVNVELNGKKAGLHSILFVTPQGDSKQNAEACLPLPELNVIGLDTVKLQAELGGELIRQDLKPATPELSCINLAALADSSVLMKPGQQTLFINVPQIYLRKKAADEVDSALWDQGINAGLLSYDFNAYRSETEHTKTDSAYLGIDSGINLLGWRMRYSGSMNSSSEGDTTIQGRNLYASHDIAALKAQFTVGDSYTSGDLMDAFQLRGVKLQSDDNMLPNSQTGFAPSIRGIADTNAKVTVKQGDIILSETSVSPGPFSLETLCPAATARIWS